MWTGHLDYREEDIKKYLPKKYQRYEDFFGKFINYYNIVEIQNFGNQLIDSSNTDADFDF